MVNVDIFTDGSSFISKNMDFYEASSAVIVYMGKIKLIEYGEYIPGGTNNNGETNAVAKALDLFDSNLKPILDKRKIKYTVRIFSDSDFTVKSITQYCHSWFKSSKFSYDSIWLNTKGEPVACQTAFKHIHKNYINDHKFDFEIYHMNGHIGEKVKIRDAYLRFQKKNDVSITSEDFDYLIKSNTECDRLAESVRKNKTTLHYLTYSNGVKIDHVNGVKISNDKRQKEKEGKKETREDEETE